MWASGAGIVVPPEVGGDPGRVNLIQEGGTGGRPEGAS